MAQNVFYKIVCTKEKYGVYFTAIPNSWENKGILYWPEHLTYKQREALRANASSVPNEKWTQYECILKCSNISSFTEARRLEAKMTECSDTEAEEILFRTPGKRRQQVSNFEYHQIPDRNDLFDQQELLTVNAPYKSNLQILAQEEPPSDIYCSSLSPPSPRILSENSGSIQSNKSTVADYIIVDDITPVQTISIQSIAANIAGISKDVAIMKSDIGQIKAEYVKIILILDKIVLELSKNVREKEQEERAIGTEKQNDAEFLAICSKYKFPLDNVAIIAQFDEELKNNKQFKLHLITMLSQIGGINGDQDGTKIGYKVVDEIFSSSALLKYSWTGVSRSKAEPEKKAFQSLEGILSTVFEVLLMADSRHTKKKNENIFKDGVLKHAKKRNLRKRCSKDAKCAIQVDLAGMNINVSDIEQSSQDNVANNDPDASEIRTNNS